MSDVVERARAVTERWFGGFPLVDELIAELESARARVADLEREAAWHRDR